MKLTELTFSKVSDGALRIQDIYLGNHLVGFITVYPEIKQGKYGSTVVQASLLGIPIQRCTSRKRAQTIVRKAYKKTLKIFVEKA